MVIVCLYLLLLLIIIGSSSLYWINIDLLFFLRRLFCNLFCSCIITINRDLGV